VCRPPQAKPSNNYQSSRHNSVCRPLIRSIPNATAFRCLLLFKLSAIGLAPTGRPGNQAETKLQFELYRFDRFQATGKLKPNDNFIMSNIDIVIRHNKIFPIQPVGSGIRCWTMATQLPTSSWLIESLRSPGQTAPRTAIAAQGKGSRTGN
jgi:hypothetical protein